MKRLLGKARSISPMLASPSRLRRPIRLRAGTIKDHAQLGVESDVLIDSCLNDTAWRMLLEPDRLSLNLGFAQTHRSWIIR